MKSSEKTLNVTKERLSIWGAIYAIIAVVFMILFAFYFEKYWITLAYLFIVFAYFRLTLDLYLKRGMTGWILFFLASSCFFVISFYTIIYKCYYLPDEISLWNSFYFSIVTFATLGYGDIKPTHELKLICASEAIVGYIYLGLLVGCAIVYLTKKQNINTNKSKNIAVL